jgi:hypothetical protein
MDVIGTKRVWDWGTVLRWLREHNLLDDDEPYALERPEIYALNLWIQRRRALSQQQILAAEFAETTSVSAIPWTRDSTSTGATAVSEGWTLMVPTADDWSDKGKVAAQVGRFRGHGPRRHPRLGLRWNAQTMATTHGHSRMISRSSAPGRAIWR